MDVQTWTQPFQWGLLIVCDADASLDDSPEIKDNAIVVTDTCLLVPVVHAQDVDFPEDLGPEDPIPEAKVEVVVMHGGADRSDAEFDGSLLCPSGRLEIGDADTGRTIDVPRGRLRIQVVRQPREFAERVVLTVSPIAP